MYRLQARQPHVRLDQQQYQYRTGQQRQRGYFLYRYRCLNQTATITVNPTESACPGVPQTFTILVSPGPTMNQPNNVGLTMVMIFRFQVPLVMPIPGPTTIPRSGLEAAERVLSTLLANVSQEDATITVTPSNANCTGLPLTFTISILPLPVMSDPPNITVCAGEPVSVNFPALPDNPATNWADGQLYHYGFQLRATAASPFTASSVTSAQWLRLL